MGRCNETAGLANALCDGRYGRNAKPAPPCVYWQPAFVDALPVDQPLEADSEAHEATDAVRARGKGAHATGMRDPSRAGVGW